MKYALINLYYILFLISGSCDTNKPKTNILNEKSIKNDINNSQMKIKIGAKTFHATLYENATATAFKAMLPLSINMIELNGNEKYADLKSKLPTDSFNPETIQNGDLMLYGSNTLVLFYKTFSTPYNYTKLGRIIDTDGLAAALGKGNVTITFELQ